MESIVLNKVDGEIFPKKLIFQQRAEGCEGVSQVDFWGRAFLGSSNSESEGLA